MFNLSNLSISSVLNSIDNAAKETLEEPKLSATAIRNRRKTSDNPDESAAIPEDGLESGSVHSQISSNSDTASDHPASTRSADATAGESGSAKVDVRKSGSAPQLAQSSDLELKQLIRKKAKEIETLNEECLELEKHVSSLKEEVREAWGQYRNAQEKSAARELELLEEIAAIRQAKESDKQQAVQSLQMQQEEVTQLGEQLARSQEERQALLERADGVDNMRRGFQASIDALRAELAEAQSQSAQGVQTTREELRQAHATIDLMRAQNTELLRQAQTRQETLEVENQQLSIAVQENQREAVRLRNLLHHLQQQHSQSPQVGGESDGSLNNGSSPVLIGSFHGSEYSNNSDDYVTVQRELFAVTKKFEAEREVAEAKDRSIKRLEREYSTLQASYDEFKQSSLTECRRLQDLNTDLQYQLQQMATQSKKHQEDSDGDSQLAEQKAREASKEADLRREIENLSHMLLKKQASLLEIQAERSSLKARIAELQNKCGHLEARLSQSRDLEHGADYDDSSSYSASGQPLRKRGNGSSNSIDSSGQSTSGSPRVLSDLQRIGVTPSAPVSRAVSAVDSWTLFAGRLLRNNSLLRLGFAFYLLLLHLWVLLILVVQTHSLEDLSSSSDPKDRLFQ